MAPWNVLYHQAVLPEYEAIRDRRARKAILTSVELLRREGPALRGPHSRKVAGTRGLRELRPGGGRILLRPLYAQLPPRGFAVLAVAPEAVVDPAGFLVAVNRARHRAAEAFELGI